jgi:hypothetical protein
MLNRTMRIRGRMVRVGWVKRIKAKRVGYVIRASKAEVLKKNGGKN